MTIKHDILHKWRFYALGQEQYRECMRERFADNLKNLWQANVAFSVLAACFAAFPILVEGILIKAVVYLAVAAAALLLAVAAKRKHQQCATGKQVSKALVYTLMTMYYVNLMFFGIYLGVLANRGDLAVSFMGFLIAAFFIFNNSPLYNLCCTVSATIVFIISSVTLKDPFYWTFDMVNASIACCISLLFVWMITAHRMSAAMNARKLADINAALNDKVYFDALTNIYNRRYMDDSLERIAKSLSRSGGLLTIMLLDIDYFKQYNDTYGHDAGDVCLQSVANALTESVLRADDFVARYGGEEFIAIFPNTDKAGADVSGNRLLESIRSLRILHEKSGISEHVTASIGAVTVNVTHEGKYLDYIKCADEALYMSKNNGRNRYTHYDYKGE